MSEFTLNYTGDEINTRLANVNNKVDKVAGKQLSTEDYTTEEKVKLTNIQVEATKNSTDLELRNRATHTGEQAIGTIIGLESLLNNKIETSAIVDELTSTSATVPLSAKQGKVLKDFVDDINTILQSNDVNLNNIQKIVDYIKQNRESLSNLGISDITGLVVALENKANTTHTHTLSQISDVGDIASINKNNDPLYYLKGDGSWGLFPTIPVYTAGSGLVLSGTVFSNSAPHIATNLTYNSNTNIITSSTGNSIELTVATPVNAGLLSTLDKIKLDTVEENANNYSHPTGDGNLHVPTTGTSNSGKVLTAGATAGSLTWEAIPSAPVTSVAGKIGVVTLNKTDIGLNNVDNTADLNKPVSLATQELLNLKTNITDIVDTLSSTLSNSPLSANQGRVLKGLIDNINGVLQSDDGTLDELQEIVDFIKQNRESLDTLGISNIAGLENALLTKVDKVAGKQLSTEDYTTVEKTKLAGVQSEATKNSTDVELRDRTTHTGEQAISTITNLSNILDSTLNTSHLDTNVLLGTSNLVVPTQNAVKVYVDSHSTNMNNPHGTTKAHVGLSDVDNFSRAHYDSRYVQTAARSSITAPSNTAQAILTVNASNNDGEGSTLLRGTFNTSNNDKRFFMEFSGMNGINWSVSTDGTLRNGKIPWSTLTGVPTSATGDTTYDEISELEIDEGSSDVLRTVSGRRMKYALDKKADLVHTHVLANITDAGDIASIDKNNSNTQYLRGDGTWATPPDTNTTYSAGTGLSLSGTTFTNAAPHIATNLSYTASSRLLSSSTGTNVTLPLATTSAAGLLSSTDQTKLNSIVSGAQPNTVESVAGKTGVIVLEGTDIPEATTTTRGTVLLENSLSSTNTNTVLTANRGKELKDAIDNINSILNSDDTTLDELQEIVDFIKQNREDLNTLGITNIAGLETALAGKADSSHSHGFISNSGAITADTTRESGDKLVLTDASDSSKLIRSNIALGTSTTTYLRNDGAWGTPPNTNTTYTEITEAEIDAGTASTLRTITGRRVKYMLDRKVNTSDIVDDLNSDSATVPLSAKQGKELASMVDGISTFTDITALSEISGVGWYKFPPASTIPVLGSNEPQHYLFNCFEYNSSDQTYKGIVYAFAQLDGSLTFSGTIQERHNGGGLQRKFYAHAEDVVTRAFDQTIFGVKTFNSPLVTSGVNITNLNADNISSGTVAAARLPTSVLLANARNTISVASSLTVPLLSLNATTNAGEGATLLSGSIASNTTNRYFMEFKGNDNVVNWQVSTDGFLRAGTIPWDRLTSVPAATATVAGVVNTGNQTWAGVKTFNNAPKSVNGYETGGATMVYNDASKSLDFNFT